MPVHFITYIEEVFYSSGYDTKIEDLDEYYIIHGKNGSFKKSKSYQVEVIICLDEKKNEIICSKYRERFGDQQCRILGTLTYQDDDSHSEEVNCRIWLNDQEFDLVRNNIENFVTQTKKSSFIILQVLNYNMEDEAVKKFESGKEYPIVGFSFKTKMK